MNNLKNQEIGEIEVLCINSKCNNVRKIKDMLTGNEGGSFFCSEECKQQCITKER